MFQSNVDVLVNLYLDDYFYSDCKKAEDEVVFEIEVDKPKLWYPYGYGEQPLYNLNVGLKYKDEMIDFKEQKIGLRKIEIIQLVVQSLMLQQKKFW